MYTIGGLFFPNILGPDMRLRYNLLSHEDLFLYEYGRFLLHKRLVMEGLLSPYASPFQPPTDMSHRTEKDTNEPRNNINKETIATKLHRNTNDITLQEDKPPTKEIEEWKTVKGSTSETINVQDEIEKKEGYYDVL